MPELQKAHPSAQHARTSTGEWWGFRLKGACAIKVNVTHEDDFHEIQRTSINPDNLLNISQKLSFLQTSLGMNLSWLL